MRAFRGMSELKRVNYAISEVHRYIDDYPTSWSNYIAMLDRHLQYWFGP